MTRQIYNIPTSCSFVDILAEKFGKLYQETPLDLADVLFLLPNRRSCQSLREAFIRFNGQKPSLLPKIIPINDIQEDEIFFGDTEILENIPPAINPYERLFIFTRLIASKPKEYGLPEMTYAQAFSLAEDL
jgi:ATP-dependent helicase/nuclease subunit B